MEPLNRGIRSGRNRKLPPPAFTLCITTALLCAAPFVARAGGVVNHASEADLRAAMAGGGTVMFACDGTITLASTISVSRDTSLDGSGHQITISGGNAVRVFNIDTNVAFAALNLTIANGQSTNGAGVLNIGGNLVFAAVNFLSNIASNTAPAGTNAAGCGGAICSRGGSVTVSNCVFTGNQAFGSASDSFYASGFFGVAGGDGCGGAIYSAGILSVEGSTFITNQVHGGAGDAGLGSDSLFPPKYAGAGGSGNGGALYILGTATVSDSAFVGNVATGNKGGGGGNGMTAMITGFPGGWGGAGGSGDGAALCIGGPTSLLNCTIAGNAATGGTGGDGGMGGWGEFGGYGGWGGAGGAGIGGICDPGGLATIINCTIASNNSRAGVGGFGGLGGFGPYGNGSPGSSGVDGIAAGGLQTSGGSLLNTLLSANAPTNFAGTVTDAGHNLSSDASCAFPGVGSMTNVDPKLGPVDHNGGPTFTMALLPGSPAIDAGSAAGAPARDQRGVVRPQGPGVDIGAYEFQYLPFFTQVKFDNGTICCMQLAGLLPGQSFTVHASSNLINWLTITNCVFGTNAVFQFAEVVPATCQHRFYRLSTP